MATPSKIRREGREAYFSGGNPELECPYRPGHWYRDDWIEGWKREEHDRQRDAKILNLGFCCGHALQENWNYCPFCGQPC